MVFLYLNERRHCMIMQNEPKNCWRYFCCCSYQQDALKTSQKQNRVTPCSRKWRHMQVTHGSSNEHFHLLLANSVYFLLSWQHELICFLDLQQLCFESSLFQIFFIVQAWVYKILLNKTKLFLKTVILFCKTAELKFFVWFYNFLRLFKRIQRTISENF